MFSSTFCRKRMLCQREICRQDNIFWSSCRAMTSHSGKHRSQTHRRDRQAIGCTANKVCGNISVSVASQLHLSMQMSQTRSTQGAETCPSKTPIARERLSTEFSGGCPCKSLLRAAFGKEFSRHRSTVYFEFEAWHALCLMSQT